MKLSLILTHLGTFKILTKKLVQQTVSKTTNQSIFSLK